MATLYRKYRPQNFEEAVGQNHIKLILEHEIETEKLAHAYLFCGPRAVGKTTLARLLAKAVNCTKRKSGEHEPCNKCASCQDIMEGRNMDIIEIDAASHTGVENVRENIIASARVAPVNSKFKVFIIDEVHMLSASAFNALLKIMEEPPATVIFILCTTEIHKVPTTIISRCQRFDFKKISLTDMVKKLEYIVRSEKIKIDKEILEAIARHSEGHMRDAESLLGQVISIGGKEITGEEADLVIPRSDFNEVLNLIEFLSKKDASSGIRLINKLIDEGVDLRMFTDDLMEILRKMLFIKINPTLSEKLGMELGDTLEIRINELIKGLSLESLVLAMELFSESRNKIKISHIPQLPLELAIVNFTFPAATSAPAQMDNKFQSSSPAPVKSAASASPVQRKNTNLNINSDEILKKWNEVLINVKKYNHSLSFILRVCEPRDLNGNQLCLAFKYKFHKDRITDPNIKGIVEKVLMEVYNQPLTIEAIIDDNIEVAVASDEGVIPTEAAPAPQEEAGGENDDMINNLLKTFGGKVVE